MMYGQYCRIESAAGGVCCTPREFIKAALGKIKKRSRFSREYRDARHVWLREGLTMRAKARGEYIKIVTGRYPG